LEQCTLAVPAAKSLIYPVFPMTSHAPRATATLDELLLFLGDIVRGQPVDIPETGLVHPTLEQRLKVALSLLTKVDSMEKKPDTSANPQSLTFTPDDIRTLRDTMLQKLAALAQAEGEGRGEED
jgi:hypothetical protein